MSFYILSDSACIWMLIFIHIYTSTCVCVCWMQKYGQSSISYSEANHLLNHYSPFIWQIRNPIYKKTFNRTLTPHFTPLQAMSRSSWLQRLVPGAWVRKSQWNILLLHRASTKINFWTERVSDSKLFQTIGSPTPVLETSGKWVFREGPSCQHKWVSILSKLTLQAKFYGKTKKAWRFSACQRR